MISLYFFISHFPIFVCFNLLFYYFFFFFFLLCFLYFTYPFPLFCISHVHFIFQCVFISCFPFIVYFPCLFFRLLVWTISCGLGFAFFISRPKCENRTFPTVPEYTFPPKSYSPKQQKPLVLQCFGTCGIPMCENLRNLVDYGDFWVPFSEMTPKFFKSIRFCSKS